MGLIWLMQSTGAASEGAYFWGNSPDTFTVSVNVNGARAASARFQRTFSRVPLTEHDESLSADGFVGQYWQAGTAAGRPAILVLGGSEGGSPTLLPALLGDRDGD